MDIISSVKYQLIHCTVLYAIYYYIVIPRVNNPLLTLSDTEGVILYNASSEKFSYLNSWENLHGCVVHATP